MRRGRGVNSFMHLSMFYDKLEETGKGEGEPQ